MNRNVLQVLNILKNKSPISRAELSRITHLTPTTISNIAIKLIQIKMVRYIGEGESKRGRKPILIEFNPTAFYIASVDLGITKVTACVIDLYGKVLNTVTTSIDSNIKKEDIESIMTDTLKKTVLGVDKEIQNKIVGIGVCVPGLVDTENNIPLYSTNISDINLIPISNLFNKILKKPVFVINNVAAMALAEKSFGVAKGYRNILCINAGYGIGSGIIINGQLYRDKYSTGELGHICVNPSGSVCFCGKKGCLETISSGHAIASSAISSVNAGGGELIKRLVNGKTNKITAEVVAKAAKMKDKIAIEIFREAAKYLGIAIANLMMLVSPEIIVLGGGLVKSGDLFLIELRKAIKEYSFSIRGDFPIIRLSVLGDLTSSIGASCYVFDKILDIKYTHLFSLP